MLGKHWKTQAALIGLLVTLPMALGACNDDGSDDAYDPALLTQYRAAIPEAELLTASAPSSDGTAMTGLREQALVGQLAIYPRSSYPIVLGVNTAVGSMITVLKFVVNQPPTFYDKDKQEFVWGPYKNDKGHGYSAVYIKDNGEQSGEDFRYNYAFIRMSENDLTSGTVIIWGASNPDLTEKDRGLGLTLWDFEANYAFEQANNPNPDPELDRGRFIALYGKGQSEDNPDEEVTQVIANFRGFVSKDNADAEPANLEYYYGRVTNSEHTVDFLNYAGELDVDDGDGDPNTENSSANEFLDVRLVFLDNGRGRAEATATGGDFDNHPEIDLLSVVECWDAQIKETYLGMTSYGSNGEELASHALGSAEDCAPIFDNSIETLKIPTLDSVDPALRATLNTLASEGVRN